jgi:hypothetical protein
MLKGKNIEVAERLATNADPMRGINRKIRGFAGWEKFEVRRKTRQ